MAREPERVVWQSRCIAATRSSVLRGGSGCKTETSSWTRRDKSSGSHWRGPHPEPHFVSVPFLLRPRRPGQTLGFAVGPCCARLVAIPCPPVRPSRSDAVRHFNPLTRSVPLASQSDDGRGTLAVVMVAPSRSRDCDWRHNLLSFAHSLATENRRDHSVRTCRHAARLRRACMAPCACACCHHQDPCSPTYLQGSKSRTGSRATLHTPQMA